MSPMDPDTEPDFHCFFWGIPDQDSDPLKSEIATSLPCRCPPCKAISPEIERLAKEHEGSVVFLKVIVIDR